MTTARDPVRTTAAGTWFRPPDGTAGWLLRLRPGSATSDVRRVRDLGLPGLLPIGDVVEEQGDVWLRTPQPPGPTLDDLLDAPLGPDDAAAVLAAIGRVLRALHSRGIAHGALDGESVLLDRAGAPLLVLVDGSVDAGAGREQDVDEWAGLAWVLAEAWCGPIRRRPHSCGAAVTSPGAPVSGRRSTCCLP